MKSFYKININLLNLSALAFIFAASAASIPSAFAAEKTTKTETRTESSAKGDSTSPEARQKWAELHQKMADCLKTEKPMRDCRQEMAKSCQDIMGGKNAHCTMMMEERVGSMSGTMGHSAEDKTSTKYHEKSTEKTN